MGALEKYAEVCLPDRWTVLGKRLEPFSIGRALLLLRLQSPFITHSAAPELADLLIGVFCCAQPVASARSGLLGKLGWRYRVWARIATARLLFAPKLKEKALAEFQFYVDSALEAKPDVRPVGGTKAKYSRECTVPSLLARKRVLMNHYGYSEKEVLEIPFAQASFEMAAWLEHSEVLTFRSDEDADQDGPDLELLDKILDAADAQSQ